MSKGGIVGLNSQYWTLNFKNKLIFNFITQYEHIYKFLEFSLKGLKIKKKD